MSNAYYRIERAIRYLEDRAEQQPDLDEVAAEVGLSKFHFQRLFRRWAGVSPKQFLQFVTLEHAKDLLRDSASVLETTYETGLSSPGRLHDLFVAVEAVTPGEYKRLGQGIEIRWGIHETPFGEALLASTERGICALSFLGEMSAEAAVEELEADWSLARVRHDAAATRKRVQQVFAALGPSEPLRLMLRGTNFQLQVWKALLEVPEGRATTYGELARAIGAPRAQRAVGTAVGANRVAFLILCHRVLRSTGAFGDYRWGSARKRAMLGWEAARASEAVTLIRSSTVICYRPLAGC